MSIVIDGIRASVKAHCKRLGANYGVIIQYVCKNKDIGLTHEQAIEIWKEKNLANSSRLSIATIAKENGIHRSTLSKRLIRWEGDLKRSIETPVRVWSRKCQNA